MLLSGHSGEAGRKEFILWRISRTVGGCGVTSEGVERESGIYMSNGIGVDREDG